MPQKLLDDSAILMLEFNGREDSLYHESDRAGNRHMEYLNEPGEYADLPFDEIISVFMKHYPRMMSQLEAADEVRAGDWDEEVEQEIIR